MGQGKNVIKAYDYFFNSSYSIQFTIDNAITDYKMDDMNGKILFPLVRGHWVTPSYYQAILSHAFRTRVYEPIVLLCYNDLPMCHRKSPDNEGVSVCDGCNFYGNRLLDEFGISPMPLSDIKVENQNFKPHSIDEEIVYRGIRISKFARSSTRKFFRRYTLDRDNGYQRSVYERFLTSAAKHVDICNQLIEEKELDAVIGFDPVYDISGAYLAVAKGHEIPTYSVDSGWRDGYILFGKQSQNKPNKNPHPQFTDPELVRDQLNQPLDQFKIEEIEFIMSERESGDPSKVPEVPHSDAGTSMRFGEYDTTVGMFTNLIWDGSLEIETAPFPDVFDWIYTTIDYFIDSNEALIIRTHPVEAIRGTNEPVAAAIRGRYDELPENIFLIDPSDDVNSYRLMDNIDVGLVYNSTIGLEMAYNNLPVIVGGDTHYREFGFTYDPDTPEEYIDILGKLENLEPKPETNKRARRYAYLLFVQKHIEFPFHLGDVSHDDIKPGNENFDFMIERILENEPVIRGI